MSAVGIPTLHWFGAEGDYNVMVIDLLGPSLEDLFNYCSRKLSLKTVLMLADQMVFSHIKRIKIGIFFEKTYFKFRLAALNFSTPKTIYIGILILIIGYVLIYFAAGVLPWQGLKASNKKDKYDKIKEKKLDVTVEKLCENLPGEN